jgi:hypothetical protein
MKIRRKEGDMSTKKIVQRFTTVIAALACSAISQVACRATVLTTSPAMIDGWTISWPSTLQVSVDQDPNSQIQVDLTKSATFVAPNQGFQITFAPTPGATETADEFVFDSESITNDTGEPFSEFSFILLNSGTADAAFSKVFTPPSGTGYSYSTPSIINNDDEADYLGTQNNGVTAIWGDGNATSSGNNLTISAPKGSIFSFKELSTPGAPTRVPEPAIPGLLLLVAAAMLWRRPSVDPVRCTR